MITAVWSGWGHNRDMGSARAALAGWRDYQTAHRNISGCFQTQVLASGPIQVRGHSKVHTLVTTRVCATVGIFSVFHVTRCDVAATPNRKRDVQSCVGKPKSEIKHDSGLSTEIIFDVNSWKNCWRRANVNCNN